MPSNYLQEVKTGFNETTLKGLLELVPEAGPNLKARGAELAGKTIIHVNATPTGGGVAELLKSQIPIERELGLDSVWLALRAEPDFFVITKKIHNLLQGGADQLQENEKERYEAVNRELASSLSGFLEEKAGLDGVLVIHDPQPLATLSHLPKAPHLKTLLRLHIDLSNPHPDTLDFLKPHINRYRRVIMSSKRYLPSFPWLDDAKVDIIQPAINPLSPKNTAMAPQEAKVILERFGLDTERPIMSQVSRFDPWKGPLGVVEAFCLAKRKIPDLQLALVGFMTAKDDPEAETVLRQVQKAVGDEADVFLFHDPGQLGETANDEFVNAVFTASDVIVQNSNREGFGLTMTEAMWHARPLIARISAGSKLQVTDGENGLLVTNPQQIADHVVTLLSNPERAVKLGEAARESVRSKFLLSHYLSGCLKSYSQTLHDGK